MKKEYCSRCGSDTFYPYGDRGYVFCSKCDFTWKYEIPTGPPEYTAKITPKYRPGMEYEGPRIVWSVYYGSKLVGSYDACSIRAAKKAIKRTIKRHEKEIRAGRGGEMNFKWINRKLREIK